MTAKILSLRNCGAIIRNAIPEGDIVIIDRRSKWGNPFRIGKDGTRIEVIEKYREYIKGRPDLLAQLQELEGKHLLCWCAPKPCHGDVLIELLQASGDIP